MSLLTLFTALIERSRMRRRRVGAPVMAAVL